MESDLQAAEDAEVRLEGRSRARRESLARRDRRRRLLPWLLCPLPLPALGAGALVLVMRDELHGSRELIAAAASVVVPALVAWWLGRAHGRIDAVLWALVTVAIELALAFGVGLVALDLGP
jgi:hypothetical protein